MSGQRSTRSTAALFGATALLGAALPLGGALTGSADAADAGPGFSGFSASTTATPIKIELFEPTIPIPASPQGELDLGYSKVIADSSSSRGRASYAWPGDAVGEGAKTILEQTGLPPEVIGPISDQGYPIQVNSGYPSGDEKQAQEPVPGSIMRTKATQYLTFAKNGYSTDCDVQDPNGGSKDGGSGGSGGGTPDPTDPSGLAGAITGILGQIGGTGGGSGGSGGGSGGSGDGSGKDAGSGDDTACQLPAQLAALVDVGGYTSNAQVASSTGAGAQVTASSRASLGDVSILGGLLTISGIDGTAVAAGDGGKPTADGVADYGVLRVAGTKFRLGPDGVEAAGNSQPIPGLPDAPAQALKMLGISLATPGRSETRDGEKLTTTTEALTVTIDTAVLQPVLQQLPLNDVLGPVANGLPDQAGPLKSLLLSIPSLAPKIVLHLGYATSSVETVQGIDFPVPSTDPAGPTGGGTSTGGTASGGGSTGTGSTGVGAAPAGDVPAGDAGAGSAPGTLTDAGPASQGLPALFSIPGALLFAAIAGATVVGSYVRRLRLAALGGGSACTHGLESGLPDLRKM